MRQRRTSFLPGAIVPETLEVRAIIERLWGKTTCQVVECRNCSGVFAFPFVSGD